MNEMRTKSYPVNLDENLRVFVAPVDYWRQVHLFLPDSPRVFIVFDKGPEDLGYNRPYKATPIHDQGCIDFPLAPGQFVSGQVHDGFASVGVLEYPRDIPNAR